MQIISIFSWYERNRTCMLLENTWHSYQMLSSEKVINFLSFEQSLLKIACHQSEVLLHWKWCFPDMIMGVTNRKLPWCRSYCDKTTSRQSFATIDTIRHSRISLNLCGCQTLFDMQCSNIVKYNNQLFSRLGDSRKYLYLYHGRLLGFPKGRGVHDYGILRAWGGISDWKSEGMGGFHRLNFRSRKCRVSSLKTLSLWTSVVRKQTTNVWPRKQKTSIDRSDTCLCS